MKKEINTTKKYEERRDKYFYALENDFNKENTSLSQNFIDKIICGDSKKILSTLPTNSIDLIFTSPPYNFNMEYDLQSDDLNWERYFQNLFSIMEECIRVLKYGGRLVINIQPLFSQYVPSHHILSDFLMSKNLIWKGEILWEKGHYNCNYSTWGSWISPSSPYLKYTWEYVEVFCKGTIKKTGDKNLIDITADEFKSWTTAYWKIPPERNMKLYGHPAMFPEELATRVIKLFSYQEDIILDCFNGVGTTTLAAFKNKRHYLGIDISQDYCDSARQRIINKSH